MPDIREVIDMMVSDGRPRAEIEALIARYNEEKAGKTVDSPTEIPAVESGTVSESVDLVGVL